MKDFKKIKKQLKDLAYEVKKSKNFYKEKQRLFSYKKEFIESKWYPQGLPIKEYHEAFYFKNLKKSEYRDHHIAYSLLKGKKYHQIEIRVAEGNEPDFYQVNRCIQKFCAELGLEFYPHFLATQNEYGNFDLSYEKDKPIESLILTEFLKAKRDELIHQISNENKELV